MKPKTEGYVIPASEASSLTRAKVLKIFESHNSAKSNFISKFCTFFHKFNAT